MKLILRLTERVKFFVLRYKSALSYTRAGQPNLTEWDGSVDFDLRRRISG
jgi:hypothetical protein